MHIIKCGIGKGKSVFSKVASRPHWEGKKAKSAKLAILYGGGNKRICAQTGLSLRRVKVLRKILHKCTEDSILSIHGDLSKYSWNCIGFKEKGLISLYNDKVV